MARLIVPFRIERRGFDECVATFASIGEALANACRDADELDIDCRSDGIHFSNTRIVSSDTHIAEGVVITNFMPAPGMILFIGWLMTILPSRATVTWRGGWPHVACPPNDDRDSEDDPMPLVPTELVPA